MCEMSQLVLGGMAKVHELIQQLLYSTIESRTLSLPLYYVLLIVWYEGSILATHSLYNIRYSKNFIYDFHTV